MLWKNMSPSSSGSKNKQTKEPSVKAVALLGLFFDPVDGRDMFLRNVS
jgi:hypothetical protein